MRLKPNQLYPCARLCVCPIYTHDNIIVPKPLILFPWPVIQVWCVLKQNNKKTTCKRPNIRNKEVLVRGRRPVFDVTGVLQTCEWGFRYETKWSAATDYGFGRKAEHTPVDVCTPPLESWWRTRRRCPNDDHENVHVHPRAHRPGHDLPTAVRKYAHLHPYGSQCSNTTPVYTAIDFVLSSFFKEIFTI